MFCINLLYADSNCLSPKSLPIWPEKVPNIIENPEKGLEIFVKSTRKLYLIASRSFMDGDIWLINENDTAEKSAISTAFCHAVGAKLSDFFLSIEAVQYLYKNNINYKTIKKLEKIYNNSLLPIFRAWQEVADKNILLEVVTNLPKSNSKDKPVSYILQIPFAAKLAFFDKQGKELPSYKIFQETIRRFEEAFSKFEEYLIYRKNLNETELRNSSNTKKSA